ncbi:MAG: nicotinamide n-methyltransferase [Geoglossum umbratile]|nr:MAG: nicotinamide n-methyltransferase [Geoglossum umbratile]
MADSEDVMPGDVDIFQEPDEYFAPPKPKTYTEHTLQSGEKITVRLVGQSPLWGHLLWNAGRTVSNYLEEKAGNLVMGRDVLELGAGAGLPSLPLSGFDLLILADLLFNHSEHSKLISSVRQTLKRSSEALALVFFTPYRPWLLEKDLAFFDLARDAGFKVKKVLEHVTEKVMFEGDRGDEVLRRTVYGYELRWNNT